MLKSIEMAWTPEHSSVCGVAWRTRRGRIWDLSVADGAPISQRSRRCRRRRSVYVGCVCGVCVCRLCVRGVCGVCVCVCVQKVGRQPATVGYLSSEQRVVWYPFVLWIAMEYGQGEEGSESLPSIALRHTDDLRLVGHRTAVVGRCHGLSAKAKRSRFLWASPF